MDLREFVAETLLAITEGVGDAIRRRVADTSGVSVINPVWAEVDIDWREFVRPVEFDVALTEADNASIGGKIKVLSAPLDAGGEGSKVWKRGTVNRIKIQRSRYPPGSARRSIRLKGSIIFAAA